jgi:hypothetical protein
MRKGVLDGGLWRVNDVAETVDWGKAGCRFANIVNRGEGGSRRFGEDRWAR